MVSQEDQAARDQSIDLLIDTLFEKLDHGDITVDRVGVFFPTAVLDRIKMEKPMRKLLPENEYPSYIR